MDANVGIIKNLRKKKQASLSSSTSIDEETHIILDDDLTEEISIDDMIDGVSKSIIQFNINMDIKSDMLNSLKSDIKNLMDEFTFEKFALSRDVKILNALTQKFEESKSSKRKSPEGGFDDKTKST